MDLIQKIREKQVDVVEDVLKTDSDFSSIIYINPYNYLFLRKKPQLLDNITGVRFDGTLMKFWANAFFSNGKNIKRQSFDMTSLAPKVFQFCIEKDKDIYIAGGKEDEINIFVKKIKKSYPSLNIIGYCNGYLDEEVIINNVLKADADLVILGLGNVKQERVTSKLYQMSPALYFTCGAFITQTANTKGNNYYPDWIDNYNLRWLYRFYNEKHVILRVLRYYPQFIVTSLWDLINFHVQEKYLES